MTAVLTISNTSSVVIRRENGHRDERVEVVGFGVGVSTDGEGVKVVVSVGSDASPAVTDSNVASSVPQAEQNRDTDGTAVPQAPQNRFGSWLII